MTFSGSCQALSFDYIPICMQINNDNDNEQQTCTVKQYKQQYNSICNKSDIYRYMLQVYNGPSHDRLYENMQ